MFGKKNKKHTNSEDIVAGTENINENLMTVKVKTTVSKKEKSSCKGSFTDFTFDKMEYKLCISKKVPKKGREDILYLLLYSVVNNTTNRSFYYSEKEKKNYYFLIKDDLVTIDIEVIDEDDNETHLDFAERYFEGEAITEIIETPKELKEVYGKTYTKEVVLFIIMFAILGFLGNIIFSTDTIQAKRPPKPKVKHLKFPEKTRLMNEMTRMTLRKLEEEVDEYNKNHILLERKRIVNFRLSKIKELPPVQPVYNKDSNSWVYIPGKDFPKRGGFKGTISVEFQQTYPGIGFKLKDENNGKFTYNMTVNTKLYVDERDLPKSKDRVLIFNEECLVKMLSVPEESVPIKRQDLSIEIDIRRASATNMLSKIDELVQKCPFSIKGLQLNDTTFKVKAILRRD